MIKSTFDNQRTRISVLMTLLVVAFALLGGAEISFGASGISRTIRPFIPLASQSFLPSIASAASSSTDNTGLLSEEQAVINVVKNNSPAVVSVVASAAVPNTQNCQPTEYFFNPDTSSQCSSTSTSLMDVGAGSGFIVSPDGYIVTNKHVVSDSNAAYTVILNNDQYLGKKVKATVVSRDPKNDIAVIKINMNNLPYLTFGDSGKLQVGQTAIAIGYALGEFANSVSKGVISGLSRSINAGSEQTSNVEQLRGLIQTDAAINPGNSGGPLLDSMGNVVGMNVAMADAQSIGFAIPSNAVKVDIQQVLTSGKITALPRAFLGIRYVPISTELQSTKKLPYDYGMFISQGPNDEEAVVKGSPADKAGLVVNDIILKADGRELNESYLLSDFIDQHKPGDQVTLRIYHNNSEKDITLKLGSTE